MLRERGQKRFCGARTVCDGAKVTVHLLLVQLAHQAAGVNTDWTDAG